MGERNSTQLSKLSVWSQENSYIAQPLPPSNLSPCSTSLNVEPSVQSFFLGFPPVTILPPSPIVKFLNFLAVFHDCRRLTYHCWFMGQGKNREAFYDWASCPWVHQKSFCCQDSVQSALPLPSKTSRPFKNCSCVFPNIRTIRWMSTSTLPPGQSNDSYISPPG